MSRTWRHLVTGVDPFSPGLAPIQSWAYTHSDPRDRHRVPRFHPSSDPLCVRGGIVTDWVDRTYLVTSQAHPVSPAGRNGRAETCAGLGTSADGSGQRAAEGDDRGVGLPDRVVRSARQCVGVNREVQPGVADVRCENTEGPADAATGGADLNETLTQGNSGFDWHGRGHCWRARGSE